MTSDKNKITIYEPNYRHKIGLLKIWIIMFNNIIASKDLIFQLFRRDFLSAYKKNFMGITWIFLSPIFGIISWVFMNSTGILQPGDVGIPYPAYVLLSMNLWGVFLGFYSSGASTLQAGEGFIQQVNYPHEILLIKQLANFLANYLLSFLMIIVVLLIFGVVPNWKIVLLPLLVLPLFFLGAGIGLVISVINAITTEVNSLINMGLGLLLFITPIIYSPKVKSPLVQEIIKWNPLTYLVGGVRDIVIFGKMDSIEKYLIFSVISLLIFMFSWRLFFISENKVIERMI